MRIAHLADIHARKDRADEVFASFDTVEAEHARNPFDLFAFSGDFWDGSVLNVAGSMMMAFIERVRRLAMLAPVVMIEGTPAHDAPGSLEVFETLSTEYGISVLRPGVAYFLEGGGISTRPEGAHALLFGVPEPSKKWLLAEAGATGKEAADKAVRDKLRALFLGLGGMRRQHEDLPCILLYHGEVIGSKTATGYGAEQGTGLTVTADDLAAVGADYIALGHIHEPQQIKGLPAYYAGSFYPKDFGETHKAGANIVEIKNSPIDPETNDYVSPTGYEMEVSRLDFPHPQRLSIKAEFYSPDEVSGRIVSFEPTMTRDERILYNIDTETEALLSNGALPGSRVWPNVLPTETVRAGDIGEKKALADKVVVWGENSSTTITDSILAKARELEAAAAVGVVGKSGATIRIDSLRLRGAKGIWKNQKKDEIFLDLSAYDSGVIALVGKNGKGKTTLIENMQPWAQLLTRDGTLKSHFRLRDSCRELHFTDLSTGWKYRATIEINAATASGGAEYWLHVDKGTGYEPLPGITGRLADYETAIGELFGSLEMYLWTAFATQDPPDLSKATKGQRKALFAELSGIDYLERYKETAKGKADALDSEIARLDYQIEAAESVAASLPEKKDELEARRREVDATAKDMKRLEVEGIAARKAVDDAVDAERKASESVQKATRAASDLATAECAIKDTQAEIEGYKLATEKRPAAEATIREYEATAKRRDELAKEKAAVDQKNHEALLTYQDTTRGILAKQDQARRELDEARRTLSHLESAAAVAASNLKAEIADHCPTCGQLLPEEKRTALKEAHEQDVQTAKNAKADLERYNEVVNQKADALRAIVFSPEPVPTPFEKAQELNDLTVDLSFMESEARAAREVINAAQTAAIRSEEAERRITDKKALIVALRPAADGLEEARQVHDVAISTLSTKKAEYENIRSAYQEKREANAVAGSAVSMLIRAIAEAEKVIQGAANAEKERGEKALESADWRTLERACGPDGIQALELDALAPSIALMTNKLLQASYGERYSVRFDTTRIGGKGSKARQIEDFLIFIQDAETGEEQEIGTLSGGEAVWFRKALYDSFAIIRAQNTGIRFATAFLDEADGALDPIARQQYLAMLQAAHSESHRHHTIIITHSAELQAMIGQTIDVAALGPKEAV